MPGNTAAIDALHALRASLHSEREWKNIQTTVQVAMDRVVHVLAAQSRQLETISERLAAVVAARADELHANGSKMETMCHEIASELKEVMQTSHAQLTERVYAHVDARLAAQGQTDAARKAEWTNQQERKHREVVDDVKSMLATNSQLASSAETSKLEAMGRQLKRLEKKHQSMERECMSQWRVWQGEIDGLSQAKDSHDDVIASIAAKLNANANANSPTTDDLDRVEALVGALREEFESTQPHNAKVPTEQIAANNEMVQQLKSHMHELLGIVETVQSEQTNLKALVVDNVQNGDQHADTKRSVLKLHDAVKSVRRSVETVAKHAEVEALHEQVSLVRNQLRSEIYQARYIWKEGRPTTKQTIAWSTQVVNSSADVFVWQRSSCDTITTMVPGLYHLQAAFFTCFEPTLQVLVNGEPALIITSTAETENLSAVGNAENYSKEGNRPKPSEAASAPYGVRRRRLHHSAGDLVGVEISAFLALPVRAAIAIGYDIDERAQGFLNMRKL